MFNKKPAQKQPNRINLNLLYPQGVNQKIPVKFLKWLLSYGRFIVVLVEIIVVASFAYRFKLDNDLANLKEEIDSKVPFIEALAVDEALVSQTHIKLSHLGTIYSQSPLWKTTLQKIASLTPPNVRFNNLSLEENEDKTLGFKLNAETNSNSNISVFLSALKKDPALKDVNLVSLNIDQGQFVFSITGSTK